MLENVKFRLLLSSKLVVKRDFKRHFKRIVVLLYLGFGRFSA